MPNYGSRTGQAARGAISGATTGFTVGGPVGAAVGGAIGLASGLLSKSPAEEREDRYKEYLKQREGVRSKIASGYDDSLQKGSQAIGKQTSGLTTRFKNAGASRASAMGRVNDTEAFQVPIVGQVANAGSNAMSDLSYSVGEQKNRALINFDNQTLSADADYADRQIEPNASDFVQELSPLVTQYAQSQVLNEGLTAPTQPPPLTVQPPSLTNGSVPASQSSREQIPIQAPGRSPGEFYNPLASNDQVNSSIQYLSPAYKKHSFGRIIPPEGIGRKQTTFYGR